MPFSDGAQAYLYSAGSQGAVLTNSGVTVLTESGVAVVARGAEVAGGAPLVRLVRAGGTEVGHRRTLDTEVTPPAGRVLGRAGRLTPGTVVAGGTEADRVDVTVT